MNHPRPFCAAHRGLSAHHPENTVSAFEAAIDAGFPALEMDLRVTRDGEVVVLHDAGIERTTNGSGRVADMRYDELRTYDTGAGPVPRLDDLLERFSAWDGLWDLEIKDTRATKGVLQILEHHQIGSRAHISSMDPRALAHARQEAPDLPRGLILLGPPDAEDLEEAQEVECAWVHGDEVFLTPDVVETIRAADLRVGAWTVNEPGRARELASHGVECIITDTPAVLHGLADDLEPEPWF